MQRFKRAILTHGGAGSNPQNSDGPQAAAVQGLALLEQGQSALAAAVQAVKYLEDDPRFNAGTGSRLRADGKTMQMDASCMTSAGQFGAVACVEDVQNPIDLAQGVLLYSPCILLVADGARLFAQQQAIPFWTTRQSPKSNPQANHHPSPDQAPACDTVGAVTFDGKVFAAALSSGGLAQAALGRVGDVPLPGCGLFCGPEGAVACTGDGEFIALKLLAKEVYNWLAELSPTEAAAKALSLFDPSVDIGLIILTKNDFAAQSRNGMAWSQQTERD
ncbi:L-asparaginase [bacterium (Candidatus Blackallbacteria) CG17_big_fil_post_rev_8_21_14_2_50_48_46]|uniref:L-asparaginase n=1 Tax=bacterium (Candidatus Blackallbacteria) CG17_big_fil_post_rev_8_21_14_2_50_48_46 TaxID=2014261 RepID=A0A2M7G4P4_9BACT|nr:MAG: L-asparaginase [bacterium (Candidatus Blackallbacteria) CG18_big_fil_WC_8_21_14_2_50_49_26]PIW16882.1 MAG: L-asparaginase [bacterium (Candidatus Blackallbacteria) CG17_big_fil_post_rev_8_21_14_2_50_48_46]PIW48079.1 MAG: L-asparaginase [bacterium (Candidatus Blackallbacteria) CG13_big_fil_rev_8_21_14_2_50_49_14]